MRIERCHVGFQVWWGRDRFLFSLCAVPAWYGRKDLPLFERHTNGGRKPDECLDAQARLWIFHVDLVIWRIEKLSPIVYRVFGLASERRS
jgi:hypothetical protein